MEVEEASVVEVNIHSPNRGYEEACNVVILARFKAKGERQFDESHEGIGEQFPVRLDRFPAAHDSLVNSAMWAVVQHLGCVSATPLERRK